MDVCLLCCILSGRCLCDELISRPEKSYRLWSVVVCDLETSRMMRPWPCRMSSRASERVLLYEIKLQTYCCTIGPQYSCR
jgi:hypothetical protein